MKDRIPAPRFTAALSLALCLLVSRASPQEAKPAERPFQDDPAAHRLYTAMVDAMRKPTTLSWVSGFRGEVGGQTFGRGTYKIWLQKPNFARVEAMRAGSTEPDGILVGDGDYFWTYWPQDKPRFGWEYKGKYAEEYEKYRRTFYTKTRTPVGKHSLGHAIGDLQVGLAMTILDPSTFHGYSDSLQPYIDGVRSLGPETVDGELCDGIDVSIMKHQRSWYLWLARKDNLPRKLKQIVRVGSDLLLEESWSNVVIDADISKDRFAWSPPKDWKEWKAPALEEGLLKPGTMAPDFELAALDGGKLKLSNFRGQIVWLNVWRCG